MFLTCRIPRSILRTEFLFSIVPGHTLQSKMLVVYQRNRRQKTTTSVASQANSVYRVGELFSGAGGLSLGGHLASIGNSGFRHIWVNDIDPDSCRTISENLAIPPEHVYCCPVESLDMSELERVDGMAFGFPCNDFSVVGERQGIQGKFGGLYQWCVKALHTLQPTFFIAENVGGMASSGKKRDMDRILKELENAGYDIHPHLYKFEEYGIPQARHRIIIVGFLRTLRIDFDPPQPSPNVVMATSRDALKDIPINAPNHEFARQTSRVVERLKHIKPGENAFTADIPKNLRLNMRSGAKISQIYKRLNPDAPAYTVTGSGGGGTHIYHWKEPRSLTNRERARLQTFPDNYRFVGGRESVRKQIGMAVPPVGAKIIFTAVLRTLLEHDIAPL